MKFTHETGNDQKLNFLDITIHRNKTQAKIAIYRKPTYTDTIMPFNSNHPAQHKYAAIRFLYNRLHTYSLGTKEYKQEENTIHNILHNNQFPIQNNTRTNPPKSTTNTQEIVGKNPPKKWCTFTYIGKETKTITNILKQADIHIAFRTNNTIHRQLKQNSTPDNKYSLTGIYKLICPECKKAYVGQTGVAFIQDTKNTRGHIYTTHNNQNTRNTSYSTNAHLATYSRS